jgi:CheY-like chemotaxis protein
MDIRLPKINGLEAIQQIKRVDPKVSIIAITANAFVEDKISCKAAGADDYISKPVDRNELLYKIEKFVGQSSESIVNVVCDEIAKKN